MPHSNTIANPDGIKFKGDTPGFANLFFCDFPELLKMGMSWDKFIIGVAYAYKGFSEVIV